jgi:hypothetical protein
MMLCWACGYREASRRLNAGSWNNYTFDSDAVSRCPRCGSEKGWGDNHCVQPVTGELVN